MPLHGKLKLGVCPECFGVHSAVIWMKVDSVCIIEAFMWSVIYRDISQPCECLHTQIECFHTQITTRHPWCACSNKHYTTRHCSAINAVFLTLKWTVPCTVHYCSTIGKEYGMHMWVAIAMIWSTGFVGILPLQKNPELIISEVMCFTLYKHILGANQTHAIHIMWRQS